MGIIEYRDVAREEWDAFVEGSPDGWLYHTTGFIDWTEHQGPVNRSFAITTETGEIRALTPLFEFQRSRFSTGSSALPAQRSNAIKRYATLRRQAKSAMAFLSRAVRLRNPWEVRYLSTLYAGPVLSSVMGDKGRSKALHDLLLAILELATRRGIDYCEIRCLDFVRSAVPPERPLYNRLVAEGFVDRVQMPPRLFSCIDLGRAEKQLWADLDEDARNAVSKARRSGVTMRVGGRDDLPLYQALHEESWERTAGIHHSLEYFEGMYRFLDGDAHIRIFFAEKESRPIAAVMHHMYQDSVFYYGGCSKEEAKPLRANIFLLWETILWTKSAGYSRLGVGLFDAYPGANRKEYSVGRYKTQFNRIHAEAIEGAVACSKKGLSFLTDVRSAAFAARLSEGSGGRHPPEPSVGRG